MSDSDTIVKTQATKQNIQGCVEQIQGLLKENPNVVQVEMSLQEFPNRYKDLPEELVRLSRTNPRVKLMFSKVTYNNIVNIDVKDTICHDRVFIKFIIPCWGVENEIGRMLDSILNQTFTDYHIVCVEDCSPDNTWKVLLEYKQKYSEKITLIKNSQNLGAGQSRNNGIFSTEKTIPSDFIWVVDGDDYLSDNHVLTQVYKYSKANPKVEMINVGWTCEGIYSIARLGWPIGLPGRVIKPSIYVPALSDNISPGDDVYSHFIMFDSVDDTKIGYLDYNCYSYPKSGRHINNVSGINVSAYKIATALMGYTFHKKRVVDELLNGTTKTGEWLKNNFQGFNPKLVCSNNRKTSILMASFPFRRKWMVEVIDSLIDQCDNFYLWLNEYDEIPEELLKYDMNKLHITLSKVNLRDNGRYTFLNGICYDDYCFICDDDIIFPPNYIKNTIQCFERNGENIVVAYYIHSNVDFLKEHCQDSIQDIREPYVIPHYSFGSGTSAFIPSVVGFNISMDELVYGYDMEMIFGKHCVDKNINVFTPQRPKRFLKFISEIDSCVDEYALHLNGSKDRIRRTHTYLTRGDKK